MPTSSPVEVSRVPSTSRAIPKSVSLVRSASPSSAGADQHVGRLDVAVDDPGVVDGLERGGQLPTERGDLRGRQRSAADQVRERLSLDQLHHEERLLVVRADVVDRHQPGVVEPGEDTGLALVPLAAAPRR